MFEFKRRASVVACGLAGLLAFAAVAATPQAVMADEGESHALEELQASKEVPDDWVGIGGWTGAQSEADQALLPLVTKLEDGTLVQHVPDEYLPASPASSSPVYRPENNVPYNTYYLKGNERGCNACHADLAQTLASMPYDHIPLTNDIGVEITVDMCRTCHDPEGDWANETKRNLGSMIHGIHAVQGGVTCMNCHDATEDGQGLVLWDDVRHDRFHAMCDLAAEELDGAFSWRQDETTPTEGIFDVNWLNFNYDYERMHHEQAGDPLDQELFDTWTITAVNLDGSERTWTLPELIDEGPSVTALIKFHCVDNPQGGPLIDQFEVTGVPVKWILEQIGGVSDDARCVQFTDTLGWPSYMPIENALVDDCLIVYQIDGEPLAWKMGYPVIEVSGGMASAMYAKQVCDIVVSADEAEVYAGWYEPDGDFWYNKPVAGFFDLYEGQVIKTGETFTIHGFADAYDEPITAIEISMDRGASWQHFDIDGATASQWVTWTYDFTPEADGAYTVCVRAEMGDGTVSYMPIEKMIVAKSDIPEVE